MKDLFILIYSRYLLLVALFLVCAVASLAEIFYMPWRQLSIFFATGLIFNGVVQLFIPESYGKSPLVLFSQLLFDVLFLTGIFAITGGHMNPYTGLYLLPIVYAVMTLPLSLAFVISLITWVAYLMISKIYIPLRFQVSSPFTMMDIHMTGMTISFTLSAAITIFFVSKLVKNIRKKEQEIQDVKKTFELESQFAKMGVIAANAAHELRTPLSSLFMIHETLLERSDSSEIQDLLDRFYRQLVSSQDALTRILNSFGVSSFSDEKTVSLKCMLESLEKECQSAFLDTKVCIHTAVSDGLLDPYVRDVLFHLISNAAQVATSVSLSVSVTENSEIVFTLSDNGPGFLSNQLEALKQSLPSQVLSFIDQEKNKRGLGLIMTQFLVKRMSGSFHIFSEKGEGSTITLIIPQVGEDAVKSGGEI